MTKKETYEAKAEALMTGVTASLGLTLVDTEYVKEGQSNILRYYIDKEGGVTIDDCEKASRAVSDLLDREDFIEEAYVLEVSSPGLGRPLKKDKDYVRNLGKEVEVRLFKPVDGTKEFVGTLKAFDEKTVTVQEGETLRTTERKNLAMIREYVDFNEIQTKEDETENE